MTGMVDHRPLWVGACLSLTGRYSRFGVQAAHGLEAWRMLDGHAEIVVADDGSDPARFEPCFRAMASKCDVLLGPYSTQLMRVASRVAMELDRVVWNHGGSGDDVETAAPGRVVSVLTPTSRYAEPFLRYLVGQPTLVPLVLIEGRGSFGRQVVAGAATMAERFGLRTARIGPADDLPTDYGAAGWDLFCAGSFEEDVARVTAVRAHAAAPRLVAAVAAGVHDFDQEVTSAEGIFGIAQWFAGLGEVAELAPPELEFLRAYWAQTRTKPDYPAVQAAAAAVLATHCARVAGTTTQEGLWAAAAALQTSTLFGAFRIDPISGAQLGHDTALVRWTADGLALASPRPTERRDQRGHRRPPVLPRSTLQPAPDQARQWHSGAPGVWPCE